MLRPVSKRLREAKGGFRLANEAYEALLKPTEGLSVGSIRAHRGLYEAVCWAYIGAHWGL